MTPAEVPRPSASLAELAADGDREAFGELISRYDERLRGLAYALLGGDAGAMDDVLQDAYLKAYVSLPGYQGRAHISTWLYRIVYNAGIDELRRRRRRPRPVDTTEAVFDRPADLRGPELRATDSDAALRMLRDLPHDQRAVLVLVDGHGFDGRAAAEVLGVPHGTIRSRLSRARASARRALEES